MVDTGNDSDNSESNKRKRQKVWDHFKLKIKDNIVVCVHCKMELAYHNSTTSMLQHLKRKTTRDKLDKKYVDIKDEMKKALQETDSVALTTDIWMSVLQQRLIWW
ncbi:hypothetical protein PAMP_018458 [Pampus punctatissimus]